MTIGLPFKTLAAFAALVAALPATAQFTPDTMMKPAVYTNEFGEVFRYRAWVPQFPKPGVKYPVILFLHGSGECGTDNNRQIKLGIPQLLKTLSAQREQVIVVAPQCQRGATGSWVHRLAFAETYAADKNPTPILEAAISICDHLIRTKQGDPDRFYITGLSLGGFGTWDAIQREPDRFAAAAPICGGGDVRQLRGLKKLPVWVAHGDADKNVPVACSRRMVEGLRQIGNRHVVYKEFRGAAHDVWSRTYSDPEFVKWLLSQNRKPKPWWKFW